MNRILFWFASSFQFSLIIGALVLSILALDASKIETDYIVGTTFEKDLHVQGSLTTKGQLSVAGSSTAASSTCNTSLTANQLTVTNFQTNSIVYSSANLTPYYNRSQVIQVGWSTGPAPTYLTNTFTDHLNTYVDFSKFVTNQSPKIITTTMDDATSASLFVVKQNTKNGTASLLTLPSGTWLLTATFIISPTTGNPGGYLELVAYDIDGTPWGISPNNSCRLASAPVYENTAISANVTAICNSCTMPMTSGFQNSKAINVGIQFRIFTQPTNAVTLSQVFITAFLLTK